MAFSIALAMILSFVESQIPSFIAIPGVKIGLANIVVVFILYKSGWKQAALISFLRVFLVSVLFGNTVGFCYSIAGALLSLTAMVLLKRTGFFSCTAVSVAGGVLHNIGQVLTACFLLESNAVIYYLPFLILSGTIAGIIIGILSAFLIKRFTSV